MKLGFITGKYLRPNEPDDPNKADQWDRVDCLVRLWILNTISKEIMDAFLFAPTSKVLWDSIQDRYGQQNGPLLYQLQRDISTISQGSSSIESYFTKLMKLRDELFSCQPPLPCHCDVGQQRVERRSANCVMQFLMGLNETYDQVRNQILVMEPLPTIDRVYSMLLSVERQREVNIQHSDKFENVAMYSKGQAQDFSKYVGKAKWNRKPSDKCSYCHMDGHNVDQCYRPVGYPDRFKKRKEGRPIRNTTVNFADTPLATGVTSQTCNSSKGTSALMQELINLFKGNQIDCSQQHSHFAGPSD